MSISVLCWSLAFLLQTRDGSWRPSRLSWPQRCRQRHHTAATNFGATNPDEDKRRNKIENDSLSHIVSSPERYAKELGLTLQEVEEMMALREQSVIELQHHMAEEPSGSKKHRLICEHHFVHGKHPFICKRCWSYKPICICDKVPVRKRTIPCQKVIVWTHHSEWGSPSNTGSVLPLLLKDTHILMKGLHENELEKILSIDPTVMPVVLWPNVNQHVKDHTNSVSLEDLADHKVILLAVEGTWRQARRMVAKLPFPRLSIDNRARGDAQSSLLAPLRSQKDGPDQSVCTAEAIVMALEGLGMERDPGILGMVRHKVDRTRRYQGKPNRHIRDG